MEQTRALLKELSNTVQFISRNVVSISFHPLGKNNGNVWAIRGPTKNPVVLLHYENEANFGDDDCVIDGGVSRAGNGGLISKTGPHIEFLDISRVSKLVRDRVDCSSANQGDESTGVSRSQSATREKTSEAVNGLDVRNLATDKSSCSQQYERRQCCEYILPDCDRTDNLNCGTNDDTIESVDSSVSSESNINFNSHCEVSLKDVEQMNPVCVDSVYIKQEIEDNNEAESETTFIGNEFTSNFNVVTKKNVSLTSQLPSVSKLRSTECSQLPLIDGLNTCAASSVIENTLENSQSRNSMNNVSVLENACNDSNRNETSNELNQISSETSTRLVAEDNCEMYVNLRRQIPIIDEDAVETIARQLLDKSTSFIERRRVGNEDKQFDCPQCDRRFNHKRSLDRHMMVHSDKIPYDCSLCDKKFYLMCQLERHQSVHASVKPYECAHCNKKFSCKSNLEVHERIHTGLKPYQCSLCDKKFNDRSNWKRHQMLHSGEMPYECAHCEMKFLLPSHLERHKLAHDKDKPYECMLCNKKFLDINYLEAHRMSHIGTKQFQCSRCCRKFSNNRSLRRHEVVHAKEKHLVT